MKISDVKSNIISTNQRTSQLTNLPTYQLANKKQANKATEFAKHSFWKKISLIDGFYHFALVTTVINIPSILKHVVNKDYYIFKLKIEQEV